LKLFVFAILVLLISPTAFCSDDTEGVDKLATSLGVVYVGMPKDSLYQVFSDLQQKAYRQDGPDEWITFSDWTTEEFGDTITFYLRDGKVRGWDKPGKQQKLQEHKT
jgi:hypothetical protein